MLPIIVKSPVGLRVVVMDGEKDEMEYVAVQYI
jgi:hypothetical protein